MGSPPFRCCTCDPDDISGGPCQSLLAPLRRPLRDRCCRPSAAPAPASRTARAMHQLYLSETAAPHPSRTAPALVEKRPDGLTGRKPESAEIRHFPLSDFRPISVRWRPIFRSPVRFRGMRRLRPSDAAAPSGRKGHRHRTELLERGADALDDPGRRATPPVPARPRRMVHPWLKCRAVLLSRVTPRESRPLEHLNAWRHGLRRQKPPTTVQGGSSRKSSGRRPTSSAATWTRPSTSTSSSA